MEENIRNPKQKRAIEKKEKIISAGFRLICQKGYHNTNIIEIAKAAKVSTGITYQYFKDKYDIFIEGLKRNGEDIFFPLLNVKSEDLKIENIEETLKKIIEEYIQQDKISKIAHNEITAMIHSNDEIANYFYQKELLMTETIKKYLIENHYEQEHLSEKIPIMIGLMNNLIYEIIYHKNEDLDYNAMTYLVIKNIKKLFKEIKRI